MHLAPEVRAEMELVDLAGKVLDRLEEMEVKVWMVLENLGTSLLLALGRWEWEDSAVDS